MTSMRPGLQTGKSSGAGARALVLVAAALAACGHSPAPSPEVTVRQVAGPAALPTPIESPASPTALPSSTPTGTPVPAAPLRLTESGCCTRAFWSPDSRWVAFIDRPDVERPAGIYAVPVEGGPPQLAIEPPGLLSADWTLLAYDQGGRTVVERVADGRHWIVPNEGRAVLLSPDGSAVAWAMGSQGITHPDLRQRSIWTAGADGSGVREVIRVRGGGMIGWADGGGHLIVSGRVQAEGPAGVWRVEPENGRAVLLAEAERPRDPLLSPGGGWLAFFLAFDTGPGANGLYVVRTDGSQLTRLDVFGAYRWRQEGQLLVIPLQSTGDSMPALLQVDVVSGTATPLSLPEATPFDVGGNEWQVSPDGTRLVFLSASDRSLWVMPLPAP